MRVVARDGRWLVQLGTEVVATAAGEGEARELASALSRSRASRVPAAARPRAPSVLVVDDDPIQRAICREFLEAAGYVVAEAFDGSEVLAALAAKPADLVVLDMLMPNTDGLEAIGMIRAEHPAARILAISSGGRIGAHDILRWASALGADRILAKPFSGVQLVATAAELLDAPTRSPLSTT